MLNLAVLSILVTAPLGSVSILGLGPRLLTSDHDLSTKLIIRNRVLIERKKNIEKNFESGKSVIIDNMTDLAVLADVKPWSVEVGEEEQDAAEKKQKEAKNCADLGC